MSQAQADAYRNYYLQNSGAASGGSGGGGDYRYTPGPDGNDEDEDDGEDNKQPTIHFASYNVKQMLEENGEDASDLVDEYTWNAQKRYATQTGQHATGITKYNSYQEYLKNYINRKGYEW